MEIKSQGIIGVRIDSAIFCGYKIPLCYDFMIAKIITFGNNRGERIVKMRRTLSECEVEVVKTNLIFDLSIFRN